MWEITLVGKETDYPYFLELENKIIQAKHNAIVSIGYGEALYISICAKESILDKIEDSIFETIIKVNKEEFMLENLNFLSEDLSNYDMFILSSVINLDLSHEVEFAKYYANLDKINNIRSFFRFKLGRIKSLWQGMARMLNANIVPNGKEQIYLDFLRYLTMVTKPMNDIVLLGNSLNNMIIMDKNGGHIKKISSKDEVDTLVNLIMYLPKKIIIKDNNLSEKTYALIKYIFEDKVSLIL